MRCMTAFDQLTWPGGIDGDDGFLHGVEEGGELALLVLEGAEGVLQAAGGGIEGAGDFADFVAAVLLDAGGEIAGGDAAGEIDDAAQAAGDAMREQGGGEDGQHQGDEGGGEKVAAQDVQRGGLLHGAEGGDAGFFVEGMGDDVAEGKVQDRRGDAQHEDKGEQEFGEDSAGHGAVQRTGFSVQRSAEIPFSGHSACTAAALRETDGSVQR